MENHIQITEHAIAHTDYVVHNEYFFEHFDKQGKDIRRLMSHLGREKRYQIPKEDSTHTGLSLAIDACKEVLNKANISGDDIDLILYTTQTPEQLLPSNAMIIHRSIGAGTHTLAFDINANCAGMLVGLEQINHYFRSNDQLQRALLIGADHLSQIVREDDELGYPFFGDIAVATLIERTDNAGVIDSFHYTDTEVYNAMMFPEKGLSHVMKTGENKEMKFIPFDDTASLQYVITSFQDMLSKHQLQPNDVFLLPSQSSLANIKTLQEKVGFHDERIIFIGDQFGYSGTSSPFLALHEGVKAGKIKRGDHLLFWTIGTGYQFMTMLFKYE